MNAKCNIRNLLFLCIGGFQLTSLSYANCNVNTSALSFAAYDFIAISPTDSSTQLSILCDPNIPYAVKLSAGLNAAGDFTQRQMSSSQSGTPLYYNLYLDSSYSQIWGDGSSFSSFYEGLSSGSSVALPIFGRIPPKQIVAPGIYIDSVVITIEW